MQEIWVKPPRKNARRGPTIQIKSTKTCVSTRRPVKTASLPGRAATLAGWSWLFHCLDLRLTSLWLWMKPNAQHEIIANSRISSCQYAHFLIDLSIVRATSTTSNCSIKTATYNTSWVSELLWQTVPVSQTQFLPPSCEENAAWSVFHMDRVNHVRPERAAAGGSYWEPGSGLGFWCLSLVVSVTALRTTAASPNTRPWSNSACTTESTCQCNKIQTLRSVFTCRRKSLGSEVKNKSKQKLQWKLLIMAQFSMCPLNLRGWWRVSRKTRKKLLTN